jgi:hypothetical protein
LEDQRKPFPLPGRKETDLLIFFEVVLLGRLNLFVRSRGKEDIIRNLGIQTGKTFHSIKMPVKKINTLRTLAKSGAGNTPMGGRAKLTV